MCWIEQTDRYCRLCREYFEPKTIWLGCHLGTPENDSAYPLCSQPIVNISHICIPCASCAQLANDGHDPEDNHPDYPDHPGFDGPKMRVEVSMVELPEPTDREQISTIENVPSEANELPSYVDLLNEDPSPPRYTTAWCQNRGRVSSTEGISNVKLLQLRRVCLGHFGKLEKLWRRLPSKTSPAAVVIRFAIVSTKSLLSDEDERLHRIQSLVKSLNDLEVKLESDEWYLNSPAEAALLHQQIAAIQRELQGYREQYSNVEPHFYAAPDKWNARLKTLVNHATELAEREIWDFSLDETRYLRSDIFNFPCHTSSSFGMRIMPSLSHFYK